MMLFFDSVRKICESIGISFDVCDSDIVFQFYSVYGQDFSCTIDICSCKRDLCHNLREWIRCFNCFDEARLWVDASGHGMNGAPYYYRDIVKDMGYCKCKLRELLGLFVKLL